MTDLSAQVAAVAVNYDVHEFIKGQRDCRDGIAHKDGRGESYDRGYSAQYELEQINGAMNGR